MVDALGNKNLIYKIENLMEQKGIRYDDKTGYDYYTGYVVDVLFDWDMYLEGISLAYFDADVYTINGIRMFLDDQKTNGFIHRHIHRIRNLQEIPELWRKIEEFEEEEHCKPFLCQSALMISRMRGSASWLQHEEFRKLRTYVDHWLLAWDRDGNGLSEWSSAPHSGADTQFERVGTWRSRFCEGVDLNSYLYRECLAASKLAEELELDDDAAYFYEQAELKKDRIQELCWDDQDGFFYDRDIRTGMKIKVKSASAFIPLWAELATKEQARTLVEEHLKNPEEFWTDYPIPSYAISEASYTQFYRPPPGADPVYALFPGHCNWCGGLWMLWNYPIIHGLKDYGYNEEAMHIAEKSYAVVMPDPLLYEWYDAETGQGQGQHPFCGMSVLGVFLPAEMKLNFDPTKIANVKEKLDFTRTREILGIQGSIFRITSKHPSS